MESPKIASADPKERKKAEKAAAKAAKQLAKDKEKWKLYIDYLHRHITIVTSKYIIWEKNDFESFKEAVEKAQRLDEKDQSIAGTLAKLKLRSNILEEKKYFSESNQIKKYFDFITRMRQLNLITKDFIKVCKKAKLEQKTIESLDKFSNIWKDLLSPKYDVAVLEPNSEDFTINHPGMKYVRWLCLFRTTLLLSNKFMDKASGLTQIPLLADNKYVGFNLSEDQHAVCERFAALYAMQPVQPKLLPGQFKMAPKVKRLEDNSEDKYKLPGETTYLTFKIPKVKKKAKGSAVKGKKGKGKGKKGKKK